MTSPGTGGLCSSNAERSAEATRSISEKKRRSATSSVLNAHASSVASSVYGSDMMASVPNAFSL